jgi:hypothetical protein
MTTHQSGTDVPVDKTYPPGVTIVRRGTWERIPWRGVFAGAFVAIAIQTLLMLIGVGIGLVAVDEPSRMDGVALATGIWWILAGTASVFVGAWVAGRLTVPRDYLDGAITGAVTWALLTVVSLWMATASAGAAIGGAYAATANAAEAAFGGSDRQMNVSVQRRQNQSDSPDRNYVDVAAQPTSGTVEPTLQWGAIGAQIEAFLDSAGIQTSGIDMSQQFERFGDAPVQNAREFYGRTRNFLERGTEADRQAIVNYLANNTELTEAEINSTIAEWQEQYRELRAEAAQMLDEATEATTDFVGEAALWTGFVLLLGLAAGCVGGAVGTPAGPAVTERTMAS